MRNCAPRFLYGFINTDGIHIRVYLDDMTGTVLASMEFDAYQRAEEKRQLARIKNWQPPVKKNGWHKARDDK
jgi:hypothetical protein